ncbi:MAG: alpha/beta hydrolase [Myxococcales bacterium]|nr:alpha/beta hydrolase [Myxococcales bacterium]
MIQGAGTQLWADVRWRDQWRIQSHSEQAVSRLLDPSGAVRLRGSLIECERALERLCPAAQELEHLVVLVHGLGRTRYSMRRIDRALTDAGVTTARLDYPSTRRTIQEHAQAMATLLDHAPTPTKLSLVTHSLGGLIVRELLGSHASWRPSVHRILMLAPPNQGAALARSLDTRALRAVMGPSFRQLVEGIATSLPVPNEPTSIFAGQIGNTQTDGLVAIEETKLEGMAEHHVVPSIHTFVMNHPAVIARAVSLLGATPDRG